MSTPGSPDLSDNYHAPYESGERHENFSILSGAFSDGRSTIATDPSARSQEEPHIRDDASHLLPGDGFQSGQIAPKGHLQQSVHDLDESQSPTVPKQFSRASTKSTLHFILVPLTSIVPLVGLIIWLARAPDARSQIFSSFTGAKIGGYLTQTEAKAIDFVCSAVLAPIIMAALNWIWFQCARVCVLNENTAHGVPLRSLTAASGTTGGNYDVTTYLTLLKARTWSFTVLVLIVLLSAIGTSALSNIIAYEAFSEDRFSPSSDTLQRLSDPLLDTARNLLYGDNFATLGFDDNDLVSAAQNMSELFDGLELENANLDQDGGYIGINATEDSMNSIDGSATTLTNVLGYRLSADCAPANMSIGGTTSLMMEADDGYSYFWVYSYSTANLSGLSWPTHARCQTTYYFLGGEDSVAKDTSWSYAFPAFYSGNGQCDYSFSLNYVEGMNVTNTLSTPYGTLEPSRSTLDFLGSEYATGSTWVTGWGLNCALYNQKGLLNFTRQVNQSWTLAESSFEEEKTPVNSWLSYWQATQVDGWRAPDYAQVFFGNGSQTVWCSSSTGDSSGMSCEFNANISSVVKNFVYASGETIRILYNTAALNESRSRPEYFYNVTGNIDQQFYRITYVPVLLLVGLVCIILAALLVVVLMLSARSSQSWKHFRKVDVVRLVVDAVGGGLHDEAEFAKLGALGVSDQEIDDWAKRYRVAYVKVVDESAGPETEGSSSGLPLGSSLVAVRLMPLGESGRYRRVGMMELDELQQSEYPKDKKRR